MTKTLIIDDEAASIRWLADIIERSFSREIKLIGNFMDVNSGIKAIKTLDPDLIFLDIQLGEKTGFDIIEAIGDLKRKPQIIFTTGHEKYALRAFAVSALDFLLKPIQETELRRALERAEETKHLREVNDRYEVLRHNLIHEGKSQKQICLRLQEGFTVLSLGEIIRMEASINYTNIYLQNRQKITVARTLKEFESMLGDLGFFRVHNSHLINLHHIRKYTRGTSSQLTLTDGTTIAVSVRRRESFMEKIRSL
jgi:two-component system, LytTR family, response regulator